MHFLKQYKLQFFILCFLYFQKYMVYLLHLQKYKALNLIYAYENFSAY